MANRRFTLTSLTTPPQLNASLAARKKGAPAFNDSRARSTSKTTHFHADLNGDAKLDHFTLTVQDSKADATFACRKTQCTLQIPSGVDAINRVIPGDADGNGTIDFYVETKSGNGFMIENHMNPFTPTTLTPETYQKHLDRVHKLARRNLPAAIEASMRLTIGYRHTWVTETTTDPLTWLNGTPPYTDCVIDFERVLAEILSNTSDIRSFQTIFHTVQHYNYNGSDERTDFFGVEAIPHLENLRLISDSTQHLYETATGHLEPPYFTATTNKENWYSAQHDGQLSGKNFTEQKQSFSYIPFADMLTVDKKGELQIKHALAKALPPVSVFVVMNKGRQFKGLGTEIPVSHVGYLVKDRRGHVTIFHSTPTTDVDAAGVTAETIDSFMRVRYVTINGTQLANKDKTAVGMKILFINRPQ